MSSKIFASLFVWLMLGVGPASAQTSSRPPARRQAPPRLPGAVSVQEATLLTNGWALLTEGRAEDAAAKAAQVLASSPRNAAALILSIEAEVARGGALSGLDQYERWLGQRAIDEPGVLRRIALAVVREEATPKQTDPAVRLAALAALADEGDRQAAEEMSALGNKGGIAETRALATRGDAASVKYLIAVLNGQAESPVSTIEALGDSRSELAIPPLVQRLTDTRPEVRGAAAQALGKIGNRDVTSQLKSMLSDRSLHVRVRAAEALMRLDDDSGATILQPLMTDESSANRLLAAEAMASRPDASWMVLVHQLAQDPDPEIRANAAKLLAPHDPNAARAVLEPLASNDNPAIRELASDALGAVVTTDLTTLRRLLRDNAAMTRVRAAAQLLAVTR
jgi:HEAT repeat protein